MRKTARPARRSHRLTGNVKGKPRKGGRKKGTPNKVTTEAKLFANRIVDDPVYLAKLEKDVRARRVHPSIESMLWHYAKGRPVERHEVGNPGDFSEMSNAELLAESQSAQAALKEAMRGR